MRHPQTARSGDTSRDHDNAPDCAVCCGMVASAEFQANVFPFILRGVNLLGVDSVELPLEVKAHIWQEFATHWNLECLEAICTEVSLEQLPTMIDAIYLGKQKGRVLVNLG